MTWDWTYVQKILPDLLIGAWYTLLVTLASSLLALIGGLMIAMLWV